jgi:hypothetical protein
MLFYNKEFHSMKISYQKNYDIEKRIHQLINDTLFRLNNYMYRVVWIFLKIILGQDVCVLFHLGVILNGVIRLNQKEK